MSKFAPDWDLGWGPFVRREPRAVQIDDGLETELWDRSREAGRVTSIRPYKPDDGSPDILRAEKMLTGMWEVEKEWKLWTRNATTSPALEMAYSASDELLQFRYIGKTKKWRRKLKTELESAYGDADVEHLPATFMNTASGRYASVVNLDLKLDPLLQIKNHQDNPGWFKTDPYESITKNMTGQPTDPDTDVTIQFVMRPAFSEFDDDSIWARRNWYHGVHDTANGLGKDSPKFNVAQLGEEFAGILRAGAREANPQGKRRNRRRRRNHRQQSDGSKWTKQSERDDENKPNKSRILRQKGERGFRMNIRIVAVSDDKDEAVRRANATARAYRNFYETEYSQGFEVNYLNQTQVKETLKQAASRSFDREDSVVFGQVCAAAVARPPTVDSRQADYTMTRSDSGVPPRAPRFEEFDQTGYTDGEIPRTSWEQFKDPDYDWNYAFTPAGEGENEITELGETLVKRDPSELTLADDEDTYEGALPRATIENQMIDGVDDQPDYVGVDTNGRGVPVLQSERNRHFLVPGITGGGKSTTMTRLAINEFARGYGGIFSDPGGEDTFELLMALPKERLDDVHIIDAGSDFSDYRVGINLLDTFTSPGEPGFQQEADNKLGVILPLLETDDYARMKRVSSHIFRGLIEANYLSEFIDDEDTDVEDLKDHDEEWVQRAAGVRDLFGDDVSERANYTVEDARDILSTKENREAWLEMLKEQGHERLVRYARQLAEMDNDDQQLEPLLGRLQLWLESQNIRRFISERESSLDIPELLLNEEILIIKCDTPNKNIRKMVNATISRLLWSTVMAMPTPKEQHRMKKEGAELPGPLSHEDYDGFPKLSLSLDELHSIITPQMDLESMLAESRKRDLSLRMATQQLCQLPRDQVDELISNVATVIAFDPGNSDKERRRVANIFPGTDADELPVSKYRAKMMIPDGTGDTSEPFICNIFPPVTPRTSFDDVTEIMREKEREDGREKTKRERMGLPPRFTNLGIGGATPGEEGTSGDGEASINRLRGYKAIYDACLDHGRYDEENDRVTGVTQDEAEYRLRWYLHLEDEHEFGIADVLDKLSAGDVIEERREGEVRYRPNADAVADIYSSGRGSGSGKGDHRTSMKVLYRRVTRAGGDMVILSQGDEGAGQTGDFKIMLPDDFVPSEYPELAALIGSGDDLVVTERGIYGELESTTGKSQPCQTLRNYADGVTSGSPVLFAVPDGGDDGFADIARQVYETMTDPPGVKRKRDGRTDFYMTGNLTTNHTLEKIWRPRTGGAQTRWYRDHESGDDVLADSNGEVFETFAPMELENGPQKANLDDSPLVAGSKSDIDTDQYQKVPRPFDPAVEGVPEIDPDSFRILIIPDADRDRGPALYAGGEVVPLSLAGEDNESVGTDASDDDGGQTTTLRRSGPGEDDSSAGVEAVEVSSDTSPEESNGGPIDPL